jgi:hypothetical protein
MNMTTNSLDRDTVFELRFQSLFRDGHGLAFPCDATGRVDMDALSENARNNYFCARTLIGRDFSLPTLRATARH